MNLSKVKSYLLTGTAGIAVAPMIGMAGVASAADMPLKAPPAPVAAPSWAGCYIGVNIGGASESSNYNYTGADADGVPSGKRTAATVIGGGQIGCNWQNGKFVYGLEGDFSGLGKASGLDFNSTSATLSTYGSHVPWMATIRGRLGVAIGDGNTLLYGTAGVAIARVSAFSNETPNFSGAAYDNYSSTRVGWAAGAGIERMIAPHWTIGAEGLFADFGNYTKTSAGEGKCCVAIHDKVFLGRVKLNYKF